MTDELNGAVLEESVILRSKMYSIKFASGVEKSSKDVQKVLKKLCITRNTSNVFKVASAAARQ